MGIKNNVWEILEGIISKSKSIIGSGLAGGLICTCSCGIYVHVHEYDSIV